MILFLLIISLLSSPLSAKEVKGEFVRYQVIDGDTLKRNGARFRLQGLDAPEMKQTCLIDEKIWSCGQASKDYLKKLHGKDGFLCIKVGQDRYQRDLVKCFVKINTGLEDVGTIMVREGYALSYRRYSKEYIDEEKVAKENKRGIWKSRFIKPWEWRREKNKKKRY